MPDIRDVYAEVEALDVPELHSRREAILASAPDRDYNRLSDEALSEMLAINRALRRKIAANAGARRSATPRTKAPKPTLEDLA